jgi:hypothetical protein
MNKDITQDAVSVEYRDNNRIQIVYINGMKREAVDAYMEVIQTEIVEKESSLLLSVHDYSNVGGIITPYFIGRLKEFSGDNMRTDTYGRVAVVTSADLFRMMFNPIVKMFSRGNRKLPIQIFQTVDEAVQWVSEYEE